MAGVLAGVFATPGGRLKTTWRFVQMVAWQGWPSSLLGKSVDRGASGGGLVRNDGQ